MAQYLSPGVYVEEVPSSIKAIAGVSTSTAAFIGIVPDSITVPVSSTLIRDEKVGKGDGTATVFSLPRYPVEETPGTFQVRVDGTPTTATLANDNAAHVSSLTFSTAPKNGAAISGDFVHGYTTTSPQLAAAGTPVLCTTFSDFRKSFGDFSLDVGQGSLAHAVYGFFNNGGARCYVARVTADDAQVNAVLGRFATIDEIAIVAAPGITSSGARSFIVDHCVNVGDRFAILDSAETVGTGSDFDPTQIGRAHV